MHALVVSAAPGTGLQKVGGGRLKSAWRLEAGRRPFSVPLPTSRQGTLRVSGKVRVIPPLPWALASIRLVCLPHGWEAGLWVPGAGGRDRPGPAEHAAHSRRSVSCRQCRGRSSGEKPVLEVSSRGGGVWKYIYSNVDVDRKGKKRRASGALPTLWCRGPAGVQRAPSHARPVVLPLPQSGGARPRPPTAGLGPRARRFLGRPPTDRSGVSCTQQLIHYLCTSTTSSSCMVLLGVCSGLSNSCPLVCGGNSCVLPGKSLPLSAASISLPGTPQRARPGTRWNSTASVGTSWDLSASVVCVWLRWAAASHSIREPFQTAESRSLPPASGGRCSIPVSPKGLSLGPPLGHRSEMAQDRETGPGSVSGPSTGSGVLGGGGRVRWDRGLHLWAVRGRVWTSNKLTDFKAWV